MPESLSVSLSLCFSVSLSLCLFVSLSLCLSVSLSLSVCLSYCKVFGGFLLQLLPGLLSKLNKRMKSGENVVGSDDLKRTFDQRAKTTLARERVVLGPCDNIGVLVRTIFACRYYILASSNNIKPYYLASICTASLLGFSCCFKLDPVL